MHGQHLCQFICLPTCRTLCCISQPAAPFGPNRPAPHPPVKVLCGTRCSGTPSARSVAASLPMARASGCGGQGIWGLHRCPTPAHQQFHYASQPRTASLGVHLYTRIACATLAHSTQQAHLGEEVAHQLLVAADLLALRSGGCSRGQAGQLGAWLVKERSGPQNIPTACSLPCIARR